MSRQVVLRNMESRWDDDSVHYSEWLSDVMKKDEAKTNTKGDMLVEDGIILM
jgi:hypothetical protein